MALAIFIQNLAGIHQPILTPFSDHPALSTVLAILDGEKKQQIILADLGSQRGKPAENTRHKSSPAVV